MSWGHSPWGGYRENWAYGSGEVPETPVITDAQEAEARRAEIFRNLLCRGPFRTGRGSNLSAVLSASQLSLSQLSDPKRGS